MTFLKILTKDKEEISGIEMPTSNDKILFIKLDNGYNIGIKRNNIEKTEEIKTKHEKTEDIEIIPVKENKHLPKILILHTGGTIASKVDYSTGAVIAKFKPEELLQMFPELNDIARIESKLIANIMSENIRFTHYNLLAREVEKNIDNELKGIIITHGTDTLHYTGAALTFALENLSIPVVLVGAQRSSDRGSSDAYINLVSAAAFISNTNLKGVFICMHENINDDTCLILNGLNARKMHTSRRDAFRPINIQPIARVDFRSKQIEFLSKYEYKTNNKLNLKLFNENLKIGILKTHPNMFVDEFRNYEHFDGLILELTGLGHAPIEEMDTHTQENSKIKHALKEICKKIPVAAAADTIYGRINMNVYTPGRDLMEIGVLGNNSNTTSETAFIKLAWLLSNYSVDETKKMMGENLRGEITEQTEKESYLI